MKEFIYIVLFCIIFGACDREQGEKVMPGEERYTLSMGRATEVDSAVVFVFQKRQTRDTFITWKKIGKVTDTPGSFVFDLPAGYYLFRVYTNIPTDRVRMKAPYSPDDFYVDYSDGTEPPLIFFGGAFVNIGTNKTAVSGLTPVSCLVELTIKNVPEGVDQIDVDLLNTSAGFYFQLGYLEEDTNPSLIASVYDVKADSTYVVPIRCFPNGVKDGKSSLDVRCYDAAGNLKYRGSSEPFEIISRMIISCSFGQATARSGKNQDEIIRWEYGK